MQESLGMDYEIITNGTLFTIRMIQKAAPQLGAIIEFELE